VHREKNLFARVVDFDNLYRAFLAACHGKRDRPAVQAFEYELEPRLWAIRRELEAGAYQWGAYREFRIDDPKQRVIRAAPFRDRVVHHAIVDVIDPVLRRSLIPDTYACIRGRGTHRATARYRQFVRSRRGVGYRVQCDIKSYFASVDHEVLFGLLARRIGDGRLLGLLGSLIEHGAGEAGRGMPIGNLTSQLFANLYLDPLDHFVKETLRVRHYVRYMDDFVLLSAERWEARRQLAAVRGFLGERLQLQLNPRRVVLAPLSCPADFVGYVHHLGGRVRVRRRLPALQRHLDAGVISSDAARASVASWYGLAKHADAFRLSRAIFAARDVANIGKRLLVQRLGPARTAAAAEPRKEIP
jgi:RNA-directed DNA polymerase